jgi:cytochrome c553
VRRERSASVPFRASICYSVRMHRRPSNLTAPLLAAGALLGLLAAAACGDDPAQPRTAKELWTLQGCITCHGKDGQGTPMAPSLHGTQPNWTREKLVEYFKNPTQYIQRDARLKEQKKRYSQTMPVYGMLPQAELEALADHVLAMP